MLKTKKVFFWFGGRLSIWGEGIRGQWDISINFLWQKKSRWKPKPVSSSSVYSVYHHPHDKTIESHHLQIVFIVNHSKTMAFSTSMDWFFRENLQVFKLHFPMKFMGLSYKYSRKAIHWHLPQRRGHRVNHWTQWDIVSSSQNWSTSARPVPLVHRFPSWETQQKKTQTKEKAKAQVKNWWCSERLELRNTTKKTRAINDFPPWNHHKLRFQKTKSSNFPME